MLLSLLILVYLFFKIYRFFVSPDGWSGIGTSRQRDTPTVVYSAYDLEYSKKPFVVKNYEILKKYAETHGHIYKRVIENNISPYWTRVKVLQELLETTNENTLIAYFDADAIPVNLNVSIPEFIGSLNADDKDIFISEDPLIEWNPLYIGKYNTGVFIVRNTDKTKEFVKSWMDMYNPEKWKSDDGKWKCSDGLLGCYYSGVNYEQGSFNKLLGKYSGIIYGLSSNTLACSRVNDNCFALHLMAKSDETRFNTFNSFLA